MEVASSDVKMSSTVGSYELHVSGGLRAVPIQGVGFALIPAGGNASSALPFPHMQGLKAALSVSPVSIFGLNEFGPKEGYLRHRIWKPLRGDVSLQEPAADVWSCIHSNASDSGSERIAQLARSISFSLHAAGIRLRDASGHYFNQLRQALHDGQKIGNRFSNIDLYDLHLSFHSIASELGSARDYLAAVLGVYHKAPDRMESLARFVGWVRKASRQHLEHDPIISKVLASLDPNGTDPWLAHLTELRNVFLHRQPIQQAARFLKLEQFSIGAIEVPFLSLGAEFQGVERDVLLEFIRLAERLNDLAIEIAHLPGFNSSMPIVRVR